MGFRSINSGPTTHEEDLLMGTGLKEDKSNPYAKAARDAQNATSA